MRHAVKDDRHAGADYHAILNADARARERDGAWACILKTAWVFLRRSEPMRVAEMMNAKPAEMDIRRSGVARLAIGRVSGIHRGHIGRGDNSRWCLRDDGKIFDSKLAHPCDHCV